MLHTIRFHNIPSGEDKTTEIKKFSGCQGTEEWQTGSKGWTSGNSKSILYDSIIVNT